MSINSTALFNSGLQRDDRAAFLRRGGSTQSSRPKSVVALWSALALAFVGILTGCGQSETDLETPNIVLIIGDDHGFGDFGFAGSPLVHTPNLDQLAAEGTQFPRAYVTASICDPSLRSLATGLHPIQRQHRLDFLAGQNVRRSYAGDVVDFETLPRRLSRVGYRSFQAGKFFGGSFDQAGFSDGMNRPGLDLRFGGPARKTLVRETQQPIYDFLDSVKGERFFLWYAPMLPHLPFDAGPEFTSPYDEMDLSRAAKGYYANIARFDHGVGELMKALKSRGRLDNTLIVYLADNGWDQSPKGQRDVKSWDTDGPHGKRSMYELAFRTPLIFHWPGRVPSGVVIDDLVSSVDLYPTLLSYAAAGKAPERPGVNLRPRIEGETGPVRRAVYAAMADIRSSPLRPTGLPEKGVEPAEMIRTEDWYFISYEKWGTSELFDMVHDPMQSKNVAADNPAVVSRMREDLANWKQWLASSYRPAMNRPTSARGIAD